MDEERNTQNNGNINEKTNTSTTQEEQAGGQQTGSADGQQADDRLNISALADILKSVGKILMKPVKMIANAVAWVGDLVSDVVSSPSVRRTQIDAARAAGAEAGRKAAEEAKGQPTDSRSADSKNQDKGKDKDLTYRMSPEWKEKEKARIISSEKMDTEKKLVELAKLYRKGKSADSRQPMMVLLKDGTPVIFKEGQDKDTVGIYVGKERFAPLPPGEKDNKGYTTEFVYQERGHITFSGMQLKKDLMDIQEDIRGKGELTTKGTKSFEGEKIHIAEPTLDRGNISNDGKRAEEALEGVITAQVLMEHPDAALEALKRGTAVMSPEVAQGCANSQEDNLRRLVAQGVPQNEAKVPDREKDAYDAVLIKLASDRNKSVAKTARDALETEIKDVAGKGGILSGNLVGYVVSDKCSPDVQKAVIQCGYTSICDSLVSSNNPEIRAEIARTGYQLGVLKNDKDPLVNAAVGQGLDNMLGNMQRGIVYNYYIDSLSAVQDIQTSDNRLDSYYAKVAEALPALSAVYPEYVAECSQFLSSLGSPQVNEALAPLYQQDGNPGIGDTEIPEPTQEELDQYYADLEREHMDELYGDEGEYEGVVEDYSDEQDLPENVLSEMPDEEYQHMDSVEQVIAWASANQAQDGMEDRSWDKYYPEEYEF